MLRAIDDDFMCPDSVHTVVKAVGLAIEVALYAQRGKLVRNNARGPTRLVWSAVRAKRENLRRRSVLISGAKRTNPLLLDDNLRADEIAWPLGAIRRHDDPSTGDRFFSKLRQSPLNLSQYAGINF